MFVLLLVFCCSASPLTAGFADDVETARRVAFARLEKLYDAGQHDRTIEAARVLMKQLSDEHPLRMKAYDLMVLSLRHQSERKLQAERQQVRSDKLQEGRKLAAEATEMLKEKKYQAAARQLSQAISHAGGDAETFYLYGYASQEAGDKETAVKAFEQALQRDGDHLQALLHVSQLYYEQGHNKKAEQTARHLIKVLDQRIEELQELALQQKAVRMNDKALATARQIIDLKQHLTKATLVYGVLTERRGAYAEARNALQRCIKLRPGNPEASYHLGRAFLQSKIFHQATLAFEQAILVWETKYKEASQTAKQLLDDGNADAAVAAELRAKKLALKLVMALYSHSLANWRRNDARAALASIDQALVLKPDFMQGRLARAIFLATGNDYPEAMKDMQQVLRNSPPNSETAKQAIKGIKFLMDRIAGKQGQMLSSAARKTLATTKVTEVGEAVKDLPGLGGKKAEAEWQELFPEMREVSKLVARGNWPLAIRRLKSLRMKHPTVADIPAILGQGYMEEGRWNDAEEMFKEAIGLNPRHAESLSNLAYIHATRGDNLPKAIELSRRAIALDGLRAEFHHTLGWALFKTGEVRKAVESLQRALALKPDYLIAHYNLGLAWYLLGSYEQALAAFDTVLAAQPKHDKAQLFKAITQVRLQQVESALETLDALKRRLPAGEVLVRVVEDLRARISLAFARHTDIPVPEIKHPAPLEKLLAEAQYHRTQGLVTNAKAKYLECQRLVPDDFRAYYELGDMYARAGLNRAALASWRQTQQLNHNYYPLQLNLGKIQLKLKMREQAREAFVKAQSLQPQNPEPHYYLGLMAYEESRFESAESHALGALRSQPRFFKAMALCGMARIRLGRLKPARDIYETLYAQAPGNSSIRRHARKKIWELTRLMAPGRRPSVEHVMHEKEDMVRRVNKGQSAETFVPNPADAEAFAKYGAHMTPEDKLWVLRQLEQFGSVKMPAPAAPIKRQAPTATLTSTEKTWVLDNLQKFQSQQGKYDPPPPPVVSKFRLQDPLPVRRAEPTDVYIRNGIDFAVRGLLAEARQEFSKGQEINPRQLDLFLNSAYLHLVQGNFRDAFDQTAKAVFYHPDNALARLFLGNMYWLGGQGAEAVAQWDSIGGKLAIDPEFHLLAAAEQAWKRQLDVNPTDAEAHSHLGIVYLLSGKLPQAQAEFRNVLELAPEKIEHGFYDAHVWFLRYLRDKQPKYKQEALARLEALERQNFPHSTTLRAFIKQL